MTPTDTPTDPHAPETPQPEPELHPGMILLEWLEPDPHSFEAGGPPPPPLAPERPKGHGGGEGRGRLDWRRLLLLIAMLILSFLLGRLVGKVWVYIDEGLERPS